MDDVYYKDESETTFLLTVTRVSVVKLDMNELYLSECFKYFGSNFHENGDINQDLKSGSNGAVQRYN